MRRRAATLAGAAIVHALLTNVVVFAQETREGYLPGAGGVKLYYRVIGAGNPVIVVHGGPGADMNVLQDLVPLAANHQLIFYDQRGVVVRISQPTRRFSTRSTSLRIWKLSVSSSS